MFITSAEKGFHSDIRAQPMEGTMQGTIVLKGELWLALMNFQLPWVKPKGTASVFIIILVPENSPKI